jgi:DNA-binding XRE family transcriptional regulator
MVNLIKPQNGDSIEFYTVEETGESGMSQSGLAVLCGVSQQAISGLEKTLTSRSPSKWLKQFVGKDFILTSSIKDPDLKVNNVRSGNLSVYTANFCGRVIQHYAFQENEIAQYSLDQFIDLGINQWIQGVTGWQKAQPRSYIPYWYQRLTLFTAKTRIPDGWWCVFDELAKLMRELEGIGYVLPDTSSTGEMITPDISIGKMFCRHMRAQGFDVDGEVQKYPHFYPDGREAQANIYPDKWLEHFRTWFNNVWKRERLLKYLGERDPESILPISKLLGLPEANEEL